MDEDGRASGTRDLAEVEEEKLEPNKWSNFEIYLRKLEKDIYAQPQDHSHTAWGESAADLLLPENAKSVLDIGCGHGFMREFFEKKGVTWAGVTLGPDARICHELGYPVYEEDMTFLTSVPDKSYDLIFARHVLEHSLFPILSLMEWKRVSKEWMILIAPAPAYWTYRGQNHYSMAKKEQLHWWLQRAGWLIVNEFIFSNNDPLFLEHWRQELIKAGHLTAQRAPTHFPPESKDVEYRFLCSKGPEVVR